ncbi:MAG: SMP-30/gluconolactonase/LRE family protein [Methylophilaceae bacterium]|nr:SMP-30/gluconolactonase/LRE family protein [Methylophilaceae bacterium]
MKKIMIVFAMLYTGCIHASTLFSERITSLLTPESVIQAKNGDLYVSEINGFNQDSDGQIRKITHNGETTIFAKGMDDPKGLAIIGDNVYVADKNRVLMVMPNGHWHIFVAADAFPQTPQFLNDLAADNQGNLYVSDSGDLSTGGAIYKINPQGRITTIVDRNKPEVLAPNGLFVEDEHHLLTVDFASGMLYRVNLDNGDLVKLAEGFGGGDGIVKTKSGQIYVSDWKGGSIYLLDVGQARPIKSHFNSPADIALSHDEKYILVPVMKAGTLEFIEID